MASKEYKKPIPTSSSFTKQFWQAAKNHKLVVQHCKDCGAYTFYPRPVCIRCMSTNIEWREVSGWGKISSYTVTQIAPKGFEEDIPYVVVSVELEEGARIMGNLVDCKPEEVKIGMDVEVSFKDITPDITLPVFRPSKR